MRVNELVVVAFGFAGAVNNTRRESIRVRPGALFLREHARRAAQVTQLPAALGQVPYAGSDAAAQVSQLGGAERRAQELLQTVDNVVRNILLVRPQLLLHHQTPSSDGIHACRSEAIDATVCF